MPPPNDVLATEGAIRAEVVLKSMQCGCCEISNKEFEWPMLSGENFLR